MTQNDTIDSTKNSVETAAKRRNSFIADLLDGDFRFDRFDLPSSSIARPEPAVSELYQGLRQLLKQNNPDEIDSNGSFPDKFLNDLAKWGCSDSPFPKNSAAWGFRFRRCGWF